MPIDWFTVGAQALNFLILVWLLKRFLYKPILDAIDAREQRIAAELADADAKKAEASQERDAFRRKNEEFDHQRATLLKQATLDAKAQHQRLLDEAREEAQALRDQWQEALHNDARNLSQVISRQAQQEVFAIARKALAELATTSLEERLADVFTRRLHEMDDEAKAVLAVALKTAAAPVQVRSAFKLPPAQRAAIQSAINDTFAADIALHFETAPELISGIELRTHDQKVAWTIANYLESMAQGVDELLQEKIKPVAQAAPESEQAQAGAARP